MLKPATYFILFFSYLYHCADRVLAVLCEEGESGALGSFSQERYQTEMRSLYIYKYINYYTVYGARVNRTALGFNSDSFHVLSEQ